MRLRLLLLLTLFLGTTTASMHAQEFRAVLIDAVSKKPVQSAHERNNFCR